MDTKNVEAVAKEVKQKITKGLSQAEAQATKELAKVKKATESVVKQAEQFVKKNPEKATLIATGIGAALGAAAAMLFSQGGKKKK
ncbi:MAG: hypothetical protein QG664_401 [Patescibacteria group bacterium]|nr:hypothetical protein [Patescibacteria group bacterium]